jgi:hypothetical protein
MLTNFRDMVPASSSQHLPWSAKNTHEKKHEADFKRRILEIAEVRMDGFTPAMLHWSVCREQSMLCVYIQLRASLLKLPLKQGLFLEPLGRESST